MPNISFDDVVHAFAGGSTIVVFSSALLLLAAWYLARYWIAGWADGRALAHAMAVVNDKRLDPAAKRRRLAADLPKNYRTRLASSLARFLNVFFSTPVSQQARAGLIPSIVYLDSIDDAPPVNLVRAFDIIIRLALLMTFAGIAAALYIAGKDIGALASTDSGLADSLDSMSKVTAPVVQLIQTASTKFIITVVGLTLGISLLFIHYWGEAIHKDRLRKLSSELDKFVDNQSVQDMVIDPDDALANSGAMRAITENIQKLSKLADSFDDKLIDGMQRIVTDNKQNLQLIIEQLNKVVDRFSEEKIQVTVAHGLNLEVQTALEGITNVALKSSALSESYVERTAAIMESFHEQQSVIGMEKCLKQLAGDVAEIRSQILREVVRLNEQDRVNASAENAESGSDSNPIPETASLKR